MVQLCAVLTVFFASSLGAASHSTQSPQSTQCAGAQQEVVNQDEVQLLQQQQVLTQPQLLQQAMAAAIGTQLLQAQPERDEHLLDEQASGVISPGGSPEGSAPGAPALGGHKTALAQPPAQSGGEMALMTQTVNKLEAEILDGQRRKQVLAEHAARNADEEHRRLVNISSYMEQFAIKAAEHQSLLETEEGEVGEQLSEEHGLRKWAETRAAAAEVKESDAERHSAALEANVSSAQAHAAKAAASAEALDARLHQESSNMEQLVAQVAKEKQAAAVAVADAESREEEAEENARRAVKMAKAEAVNATVLAHKMVETAQSEASAKKVLAAQAKQAALEAVSTAQTEARMEIRQARTEVAAEVQVTHDSLEKAERLMQNWFNTTSPEMVAPAL